MKKKQILKIAADICLSAALLFNMSGIGVSADGERSEEFRQSGDWLYIDRGEYISVCGYSGNEEHITIPSEIDGKEVREITCKDESGIGGSDFFGYHKPGAVIETSVKHITFPETIRRIGDYVFYRCSSLEQADLPQGLVTIGAGAFGYCEQLVKAEIPDSVKNIGYIAFEGTGITSFDLPEGLEYIGGAAFCGTPVTRIEIPDTVKYLGGAAFSGCSELESAKLPKGIQTVSNSLFYNCDSLKSVEIPEGVLVIEWWAFAYCTGLEEIYFPSTVISVNEILCNNSSLKNIYFAAGKETVEAFKAVKIDNYFGFSGDDKPNLDLISIMTSFFDHETDYSGVTVHYGEKSLAEEKTAEELIKTGFMILSAVFAVTLITFLCLYLMQKGRNKPRSVARISEQTVLQISQGNALTRLDSFEGIRCKKCGAESGEKADYCYNCGKKLSYKLSKFSKLSKNKGKEL